MVSFELGKEIEEDVFRLVTSMGPRKKILSLHEVRFLMRTQFFFSFIPRSWQDEKQLPLLTTSSEQVGPILFSLFSNWKHNFFGFCESVVVIVYNTRNYFHCRSKSVGKIYAQNKFIQHLIGFVWFNFFSEECFIPLYNSLAQIKKWLHCTPCIIQCPYQLLREMYTICQWLFDIVDRRKKHTLQPRTYCG